MAQPAILRVFCVALWLPIAVLAATLPNSTRDPLVISEYKRYVLKLAPLRGVAGAPMLGLTVDAVIEAVGPLHLLLDTGAHGIIVNRSAVRDLKFETATESEIGGISSRTAASRIAAARTVSFGPLQFRDVEIEVADTPLASGIDGVVGLDTFRAFQIRVDTDARALELVPFSDAADGAPSTAFYALRHLILVKAKLNRNREGLFLLDTGAAFTSIAKELMPSLDPSSAMLLSGPCGSQVYGYRAPPVMFDIDGQAFVDPAPIALDLRHIRRQEGVDIAGIIGFPTLARSTLTIDYRHGVFELKKRH